MACLSHKYEGVLRDLCECPAELGDNARIAEVRFVYSFKFVMYWVAIVGSVNVKLN